MSSTISIARFSKVAFVGGGTGGHALPIIALIHQHEDFKLKYLWLGGKNSFEESEARKENIAFYPISTIKLAGIFSLKAIIYPFVTLIGVFQARKVLVQERPDIIFSKGGPGSLSVGIAAWLLMIPLWIHESDTIPGFSNRILGVIAERIYLGFSQAIKYFPEKKTTVCGQIIHPDIYKPAKQFRYWKTEKNHVLVLCGSQGSRNILKAIAKQCEGIDIEWVILLGLLNADARSQFHRFQNITLYDWIDPHTLGSILRDTDLVITRGGATTLAEIDIYNVRKLIIPLPWSSNNHQLFNAKWYEEYRKDIILEEENINNLNTVLGKVLSAEIISQSLERKMDFLN